MYLCDGALAVLFWDIEQTFVEWSAKAGVARDLGHFIPPLEPMAESAKTVYPGVHRVSFQIMGSMLPSDMTLRKCPNLSEPPLTLTC